MLAATRVPMIAMPSEPPTWRILLSRVMPVPISQRGPTRLAIRPAAGDEHDQHVPGRKVAPPWAALVEDGSTGRMQTGVSAASQDSNWPQVASSNHTLIGVIERW